MGTWLFTDPEPDTFSGVSGKPSACPGVVDADVVVAVAALLSPPLNVPVTARTATTTSTAAHPSTTMIRVWRRVSAAPAGAVDGASPAGGPVRRPRRRRPGMGNRELTPALAARG